MATAVMSDEVTTSLLDLPDHIIVENVLKELFPSSLHVFYKATPKDLRDILSFASTCKRIHELASHPSLWRGVNAMMFSDRSIDAIGRGAAPPPLPLGAVHCGVFRHRTTIDKEAVSFMETFHDLTDVLAGFSGCEADDVRERFARIVSSLPRIARFSCFGDTVMSAFIGAGVPLPPSLEYLVLVGDSEVDTVGVLAANTLPSLTSLSASVIGGSVSAVVAAVVVSCPALVEIGLRGRVAGRDVVSLASSCQSLRKVAVQTILDLTDDGVAPMGTAVNLHELVVRPENSMRVTNGFLSLFKNLVRLELCRSPEETGDLRAIGGMMNLEHLMLDGGEFVGDSCRRLLPLVNHPKTNGRRSLKSLVLWNFGSDLGDFLSSPWCSSVEDLSLHSCALSDSTLERFTADRGKTFASTLHRLAVDRSKVDGRLLGRFFGALQSLTELTVISAESDFDVNAFTLEMGRSHSMFSRVSIATPGDRDRIDVTPILHVISTATEIHFRGNVDQSAVDSIAAACHSLRRFTVESPNKVYFPGSSIVAWKYIYDG